MAAKINPTQLRDSLKKYKVRWQEYHRFISASSKEKAILENVTSNALGKLLPNFSFDSNTVIADIDAALLACAWELRVERDAKKAKEVEAVRKAKAKAKAIELALKAKNKVQAKLPLAKKGKSADEAMWPFPTEEKGKGKKAKKGAKPE